MRARSLQSSMIKRIVYDEDAETLSVQFHNRKRYFYFGVPRAVFDAFGKAASAGKFFNEWVKGQYRCELDPAQARFRPQL